VAAGALGETPNGGLSITELSRLSDVALSSASRYVHGLADKDRHGRPGMELVDHPRDPMNDAKKVLKVTGKGRRLLSQLATATGA